MTAAAPLEARPCRGGCGVDVLLVRRAVSGRWDVVEVTDREPSTQEAAGCLVVVGRQAWSPLDLVEHFHVTQEISEAAARDLVNGYPWHRPHRCQAGGGG